jgi:hypothetical protein
MHETIESEMNIDVGGTAVVTIMSVAEEGYHTVRGTILIG